MEIVQKFLNSGFRRIPAILACAGFALFQGCFPAPTDKNQRGPQDVAHAFVHAVQKGELKRATSFWEKNSISNVEANFNSKFEDFCLENFKCDTFTLSGATKQKAGYWLVRFEGTTKRH